MTKNKSISTSFFKYLTLTNYFFFVIKLLWGLFNFSLNLLICSVYQVSISFIKLLILYSEKSAVSSKFGPKRLNYLMTLQMIFLSLSLMLNHKVQLVIYKPTANLQVLLLLVAMMFIRVCWTIIRLAFVRLGKNQLKERLSWMNLSSSLISFYAIQTLLFARLNMDANLSRINGVVLSLIYASIGFYLLSLDYD